MGHEDEINESGLPDRISERRSSHVTYREESPCPVTRLPPKIPRAIQTSRPAVSANNQIPDGSYITTYQVVHCNMTPPAPPAQYSEFPPRSSHPTLGQGNFNIGYSRTISTSVETPLSTQPQKCVMAFTQKGSNLSPSLDADPFVSSLRHYPECSSPKPIRTVSSGLLQRLLAYKRTKNFIKSSYHSESMRSLRLKRRSLEEPPYRTRKPKLCKTSIKNGKSNEEIKEPIVDKGEEKEDHQICARLTATKYLRYTDNQAKETYNYLKTKHMMTDDKLDNTQIDVRYFNDVPRCIRKALRRICDDDAHDCTSIQTRYEKHRKKCHKAEKETHQELCCIPPAPPKTCTGQVQATFPTTFRDVASSSTPSHSENQPGTVNRTRCCCCKNPLLSSYAEISFQDRNLNQDSSRTHNYALALKDQILDWLKEVPVYDAKNAEEEAVQENLRKKLLENVKNATDYDTRKNEILKFIEQYPIQPPDNYDVNTFKKEIAEKLLENMRPVQFEPPNFNDEIIEFVNGIIRKTNPARASLNKHKLIHALLNRINFLSTDRLFIEKGSKSELKHEILRIVRHILGELEENRQKGLDEIADKFSEKIRLKIITDTQYKSINLKDQKFGTNQEEKLVEQIWDLLDEYPEITSGNPLQNKTMVKELVTNLQKIKTEGDSETVQDEMIRVITDWLKKISNLTSMELKDQDEFAEKILNLDEFRHKMQIPKAKSDRDNKYCPFHKKDKKDNPVLIISDTDSELGSFSDSYRPYDAEENSLRETEETDKPYVKEKVKQTILNSVDGVLDENSVELSKTCKSRIDDEVSKYVDKALNKSQYSDTKIVDNKSPKNFNRILSESQYSNGTYVVDRKESEYSDESLNKTHYYTKIHDKVLDILVDSGKITKEDAKNITNKIMDKIKPQSKERGEKFDKWKQSILEEVSKIISESSVNIDELSKRYLEDEISHVFVENVNNIHPNPNNKVKQEIKNKNHIPHDRDNIADTSINNQRQRSIERERSDIQHQLPDSIFNQIKSVVETNMKGLSKSRMQVIENDISKTLAKHMTKPHDGSITRVVKSKRKFDDNVKSQTRNKNKILQRSIPKSSKDKYKKISNLDLNQLKLQIAKFIENDGVDQAEAEKIAKNITNRMKTELQTGSDLNKARFINEIPEIGKKIENKPRTRKQWNKQISPKNQMKKAYNTIDPIPCSITTMDNNEKLEKFIKEKVNIILSNSEASNKDYDDAVENLTSFLVNQAMRGVDDKEAKNSLQSTLRDAKIPEHQINIISNKLLDSLKEIPLLAAEDNPVFNDNFEEIILNFIEDVADDGNTDKKVQRYKATGQFHAKLKEIIKNKAQTMSEKESMLEKEAIKYLRKLSLDTDITPNELVNKLMDQLPKTLYKTSSPQGSTIRYGDLPFQSYMSSQEVPSLIGQNISNKEQTTQNGEQSYINLLSDTLAKFIDSVHSNLEEVKKKKIVQDLTSDIIDRFKYLQLNNNTKTSDENELDHLQYEIFRTLNNHQVESNFPEITDKITTLMEQVKALPVPQLVKLSGKRSLEDITKWCDDLKLKPDITKEEELMIIAMKKQFLEKLMLKISELNVNPEIFYDDFLYTQVINDEIDELLSILGIKPYIENESVSTKQLIEKIMQAKKKVEDELKSQTYKQKLRDTISKTLDIPRDTSTEDQIYFEEMVDSLADAFTDLHYVGDDDELRNKYRQKIAKEVNNFCDDYLNRNPGSQINPLQLNKKLYSALRKVSLPKDESLRSEVEKARIKQVIKIWLKELPLRQVSGLQGTPIIKLVNLLAKNLHNIENETPNSIANKDSIQKEITKFLKKMPLSTDDEKNTNVLAEKLVNSFLQTQQSRQDSLTNMTLSKAQISNPLCPYYRSMIEQMRKCDNSCLVNTETQSAGLQNSKDKANDIRKSLATRLTCTINDSSVDPVPVDISSQAGLKGVDAQISNFSHRSRQREVQACPRSEHELAQNTSIPDILQRHENSELSQSGIEKQRSQNEMSPTLISLDYLQDLSKYKLKYQVPCAPFDENQRPQGWIKPQSPYTHGRIPQPPFYRKPQIMSRVPCQKDTVRTRSPRNCCRRSQQDTCATNSAGRFGLIDETRPSSSRLSHRCMRRPHIYKIPNNEDWSKDQKQRNRKELEVVCRCNKRTGRGGGSRSCYNKDTLESCAKCCGVHCAYPSNFYFKE